MPIQRQELQLRTQAMMLRTLRSHDGPSRRVNASCRRPIGVALAALAMMLARPAIARAQHPMPGMSGHDSITVPANALYTVADVEFMQGMIAHHSQAIYMSRMAEAHKAGPRLLRLAQKIEQSQVAEVNVMREWLRQNGQFAPDTSSWRTMMMPGMLTKEQLEELDAATGPAFDRTYLTMMIQHHEGALEMVKTLFATPRAGQEVNVNVFANDVVTVQTAEIGIMQRMLSQLSDQ
jgi:uncharacterized protein (DUF305 family)